MARLDTDLIGLPIVSMEDASVVAEVDGLVIDDSTLTVAGFLTNVGLYEASILPFAATRAVGDDAVIVRSADALVRLSANPALAALAEKGIEISGARLVTLSGKEVGSVGGYFVDDRGRVVGLEFISEDPSPHPRDPSRGPGVHGASRGPGPCGAEAGLRRAPAQGRIVPGQAGGQGRPAQAAGESARKSPNP